MEILKFNDWKDEQLTLHLITQILGKYKVECAYQEPQCYIRYYERRSYNRVTICG